MKKVLLVWAAILLSFAVIGTTLLTSAQAKCKAKCQLKGTDYSYQAPTGRRHSTRPARCQCIAKK